MTADFTVGDATKYNAIITGNEIQIRDLNQFLKDWREIKSKAEKWDKLKNEDPDATIIPEEIWQETFDQLNEAREVLEPFFEEEAPTSLLSDYAACYEALGKLKDILLTSEVNPE